MSNAHFNDEVLLQDADVLLKDAGFSTRRGVLAAGDVPYLLAEDRFFILVVIASRTLQDAQRAEPVATHELLDRLASSDVGAKRWDAYVVLLAEDTIETPEQTREVVDLQYNTSGVRRLVALGVVDAESLRAALRPFLPLPPTSPGGLGDALEELVDQLILNGVPAEEAPRYVAAFAQAGNLDDL